MLKKVELFKEAGFKENAVNNYLVHDSAYFKAINFNFSFTVLRVSFV